MEVEDDQAAESEHGCGHGEKTLLSQLSESPSVALRGFLRS